MFQTNPAMYVNQRFPAWRRRDGLIRVHGQARGGHGMWAGRAVDSLSFLPLCWSSLLVTWLQRAAPRLVAPARPRLPPQAPRGARLPPGQALDAWRSPAAAGSAPSVPLEPAVAGPPAAAAAAAAAAPLKHCRTPACASSLRMPEQLMRSGAMVMPDHHMPAHWARLPPPQPHIPCRPHPMPIAAPL